MISALLALGAIGLAGLLFLDPRRGFFALFLVRPLIELSRAFPDVNLWGVSLVQLAGVGIPALLMLILVVRARTDMRLPLPVLGVVFAFTIPVAWSGAGGLELWLRLVSPLPLVLFPQLMDVGADTGFRWARAVFNSIPFVLLAMIVGWTMPLFVPAAVAVGGESVERLGGVFGVPTMTGYWLSIFVVLSAYLWWTDKRPGWRAVYVIAGLLLLVPLYATFSRTAWAGCIVAITVWLGLRGNWRGVAGVLAVGGVIMLSVAGVRDRLFAPNWGGTGRTALWIPGFRMYFDASPGEQLFGVGWGNVYDRVRQYVAGDFALEGTGITENTFLFLLFGGGLVALIAYVVFCYWSARGVWYVIQRATPGSERDFALFVLAMLAMMLVQGMTGDQILSPVLVWYFYAFLGVALALQPRVAGAAETPPLALPAVST